MSDDFDRCRIPDTEDPAEVWCGACEGAIRAVERARFKKKGDVAIKYATQLLGVAHRLKGVACPQCYGEGRRSYPSTATWRGGCGGQAFTTDVCDTCWGTGRTDRRGADLRAIHSQLSNLEQKNRELLAQLFLHKRIGPVKRGG
jgi:hypothetical protein